MTTRDGIHEGSVYVHFATQEKFLVEQFCKMIGTDNWYVNVTRVGMACAGGSPLVLVYPLSLFRTEMIEEYDYVEMQMRKKGEIVTAKLTPNELPDNIKPDFSRASGTTWCLRDHPVDYGPGERASSMARHALEWNCDGFDFWLELTND